MRSESRVKVNGYIVETYSSGQRYEYRLYVELPDGRLKKKEIKMGAYDTENEAQAAGIAYAKGQVTT